SGAGRDEAGGGFHTGLAVRFAQPYSFRGVGGGLRRFDAQRRRNPTQRAGSRCVAEHLSPVALLIGSRFRAGRSLPPQGRREDGARLFACRSALGTVTARRNARYHQLHRAPVVDLTRWLCGSVGGAERLGAGPAASVAEVVVAATGAARGDADRAAVRWGAAG